MLASGPEIKIEGRERSGTLVTGKRWEISWVKDWERVDGNIVKKKGQTELKKRKGR